MVTFYVYHLDNILVDYENISPTTVYNSQTSTRPGTDNITSPLNTQQKTRSAKLAQVFSVMINSFADNQENQ